MPREYPRSRRLADQMQRVLNEIIREELQDPRLEFVTVSAVDVSGDLRQARAWFSILPPDADSSPALAALSGAAGRLRRRLGKKLVIRKVPALEFEHDDSSARGERLSSLIDAAIADDQSHGRDGS
jgi:ribosome-binding factor A